MGETPARLVKKLNAIPGYRSQFQAVFGTEATAENIAKAIASFERTIVSGISPFDGWEDSGPEVGDTVKRGFRIYYGKGHCYDYHGDSTLSDQSFHNLGAGMKAANRDVGRENVSHDPNDRGKFKTPGLRCVAMTAPYLHDGSAATLEDAIEFHNQGGEPNPNLDPLIKPLNLTKTEVQEMTTFIEALCGPVPMMEKPELPPNPKGH